jgi:hypothetical protein
VVICVVVLEDAIGDGENVAVVPDVIEDVEDVIGGDTRFRGMSIASS